MSDFPKSAKYSKAAADKFYGNKGTGGSRVEPVFSLKVSESKKYENDNQWFKDYIEYIVPASGSTIDDYDEMKTCYEVINNNLDGFKKQIDDFLNPFASNIGEVDETLFPYPKLHTSINVLKGEMISRNDHHKIVLLTANAVKDKNEKLIEELKASVEEEVMEEITKIQQQLEGKSPEEIQKYIEETRQRKTPEDILRRDWKSDLEIFYSKGLKFCYFDQDIKRKKVETFEDLIVSDRFFIYSGWRFGKPYLEVRNPLYTGFHKSPNEPFINKGDYVWYKKPITIADAYNNYGNMLEDDDLERLGVYSYSSHNRADKRHSLGNPESTYAHDNLSKEIVSRSFENARTSQDDKRVGLSQGQGTSGRMSEEALIWETHIEFKAFRKIIYLSYIDEFNQKVNKIVPESYDVPKEAEKVKFTNMFGEQSEKKVWFDEVTGIEYSAEEIWIPRKYEVIRLGEDIYPVCREVPFQVTNIEEPFSTFNLSTFGGIATSRNAKSVSLLQRALPVYFQYIYLKHIQNRELAKYQSFIQSIDLDQIPEELGQDIYGNQIRDEVSAYLATLRRTNRDFYSGSQTALGGLPPATRSPGSSVYTLGAAAELLNLQNLLEFVDREMMMAMGISPQRMSMFSNNSNVTDNQIAIAQSHHITEPYYFFHSEIWRQALNDYLYNFRTYNDMIFNKNEDLKEHSMHYILPDGTEEVLNVTPDMLQHTSIGLFVSEGGANQRYMDIMLQASQAFAQNSGEHGLEAISTMIKAITAGSSPEEVHRLIQIEADKQNKRMQEMEQLKLQSAKEAADIANRNREDEQAHKLEEIRMKGEYDLLETREDNQTKLQIAEKQAERTNYSKD